jgi:hypothetical protein
MRWAPRAAAAATLAAVAAATTLALSGAAGAATGPQAASAGQAGMTVTGAQIRDIRGLMFARNGGGFASTQAGIGGSVSLWAPGGTTVLLGASTGTGSAHQPWSPGINIYSGHTLVASQNDASVHGQTCTGSVCTPGDAANWPDQQLQRFELFYNRATGNVEFSVRAVDSGVTYSGFYHVGTGVSFTQARMTGDFGNTPFDSAGYTHAPGGSVPYLAWSGARLTSYSGHKAGLASWWTRHHLVLVDGAGHASAGPLASSGSAFRTFLAP